MAAKDSTRGTLSASELSAFCAQLALITKELQNTADGLPAVTLSVGVAFSAKGYSDELFNQADKALYAVKDAGRNGMKFYDELSAETKEA